MIALPYVRTRILAALPWDRRRFDTWQSARLRRWLTQSAVAVEAFVPLEAEVQVNGLHALPIAQRADVIDTFAARNRLGLDADTVLDMEANGSAPAGFHVGRSTGTSGGQPMPYIVSDAERTRWLGTLLAKALPEVWRTRPRVAVILPRSSPLYDRAGGMVHVLSPADGWDQLRALVKAIDPTVIVGPPRALLSLDGLGLAPRRVVMAAEVVDAHDREHITGMWPAARVGEIYMATEGLFAVSCERGSLHLVEDRVHVELRALGHGLAEPIVTDFSRTTQIMARYATGDVVRLHGPCACGSPLRSISVLGRLADWPKVNGVRVPFDTLSKAIRDAGAPDFRLRQTGATALELTLDPETRADEAARAVEGLLPAATVSVLHNRLAMPTDSKLRRITRAH